VLRDKVVGVFVRFRAPLLAKTSAYPMFSHAEHA
jgi:hypothetical protein